MKIYIDGKYYDEKSAKISVFDHGLLYGDGIFEGIRAYNGRIFKLKEHVDRLYCSAKAILLTIPFSPEEIRRAVIETCRRNKMRDGYIRLLVTAGLGPLGLNPARLQESFRDHHCWEDSTLPAGALREGTRDCDGADDSELAQRPEPGD
jgi:branched-chain amino acid aminotransferase